ncbi:ribosome maturation factor RimM [Novispirillum itersonii]|uniref:ribosome maturation factor RimM n=1 Tax=Novispirillum itersonii TaxID=189 RepID=UPI0016128361|nr:ribosome maturation factor RimM [Novispirillum itersonii]
MSSGKPSPETAPADLVCVGVLVGAHGVRGVVKVKPFTTDPDALDAYGPLTDDTGTRVYALEVLGVQKGSVLCLIDGVDDRDKAEAVKGLRLYIRRDALPDLDDEDEFYHSDLIGLSAVFPDGTKVGVVTALFDFGAGDVLELRGETGGVAMVPFTKAAVPVIDVAGGKVVVEPIEGLLEGPIEANPAPRRRSPGRKQADAEAAESAAVDKPVTEEWPDEDWQ